MTEPAQVPLDDASKAVLEKIVVSKDHLLVSLPTATKVDQAAASWTFEQFKLNVKNWGFIGEPNIQDFSDFISGIQNQSTETGIETDLVILRGTPTLPPQEGRIEWLNEPPVPPDLAVIGRPVLRVAPPSPAAPGLTVYGQPIEPSSNDLMPEPLELTFTDGIVQNADGTFQTEESGQIKVEGTHITFTKGYSIHDASLPIYREAEFPCDVIVPGDLAGLVKWKIFGSLIVKGHWSAPGVEVHGNAQSESGLATGNEGVIKIYGNFRTTYIQFSHLGVSGDLAVDSSIVQSDVRVGGNILCKGDPGVIMGSEVSCFGAIVANKVGSDKGRRTRIQVHRRSHRIKTPRTRIGMLSKDTRMRVYGEIWTQIADNPYESPDIA